MLTLLNISKSDNCPNIVCHVEYSSKINPDYTVPFIQIVRPEKPLSPVFLGHAVVGNHAYTSPAESDPGNDHNSAVVHRLPDAGVLQPVVALHPAQVRLPLLHRIFLLLPHQQFLRW